MITMYTITVNDNEYGRGLYNTRNEALAVAVKMAKDDNPGKWEGLDDEDVYEYQDEYYRVLEIEMPRTSSDKEGLK